MPRRIISTFWLCWASKSFWGQKWVFRCYLELGNCSDALELLKKAYEMAKNIFAENDNRCAGILTLVSNCFVKMKKYPQALDYIQKVLKLTENTEEGSKSESCALVLQEAAKIYAKQNEYGKATDYQQRTISWNNIFLFNLLQKSLKTWRKMNQSK